MPGRSDLSKVGVIYFIESPAQNAVKIGFADDVYMRLKGLQTGNPDELTLLGTVPATRDAELVLHRLLRPYCIRLEWYPNNHLTGYLLDALQDEVLDRAMAWLAAHDPSGTDPNDIAAAVSRQVLSRQDIAAIVREEMTDYEASLNDEPAE
ncbi:MAG: GIY-YIG nuclease family protein [Devosia sp.]